MACPLALASSLRGVQRVRPSCKPICQAEEGSTDSGILRFVQQEPGPVKMLNLAHGCCISHWGGSSCSRFWGPALTALHSFQSRTKKNGQHSSVSGTPGGADRGTKIPCARCALVRSMCARALDGAPLYVCGPNACLTHHAEIARRGQSRNPTGIMATVSANLYFDDVWSLVTGP